MRDLGTASSIAELIDFAKLAETQFREMPWFRGHVNSGWKLVPSAHRHHPILETQFAQQFRLRAPSLSPSCPTHEDTAAWLPLMRHYGLPTRLLDWSESILVAAYFALSAAPTATESAIWVLSPGRLNAASLGNFVPFLTDHRVKPLVSAAFGANIGNLAELCLAVAAPRSDRRMAAQLGNYTIHGTREPLEQHAQSDTFLYRVRIPAIATPTIRRELSLAGVRSSILFPDLESLARELSELRAIGEDGEYLGTAVSSNNGAR